MLTYTHVGRHDTIRHSGPALKAHGGGGVGRLHALTGPVTVYEGAVYRSLCGETVRADATLDDLTVWQARPEWSAPNCKTCLRVLAI